MKMITKQAKPATILITGASSGLGAALAVHYARPSVVLALMGRNAQRLESVAEICREQGATVHIGSMDVGNAEAMERWITDFDSRHPIDLCIANAGISAGSAGGGETLEQITHIFDVNLMGVINTIHPLLDRMRTSRSGHIAMVSSVAGFRGLPTAPSYSASKAALRYYAQALRGMVMKDNVTISVICPGFIRTPLTDVNPFPMPFIMSAEKAARIIAQKLEKRRYMIAFPWPLVMLSRLQALLPDALINRIYSRIPAKPSEIAQ